MIAHRIRTSLVVITAVTLLAAHAPTHAAEAMSPHERWYVVTIQGQRAGYVHEQTRTADGKVTTEIDMRMSVQRGATPLSIEMGSRFVETVEGEPVVAVSTQRFAETEISKTITFAGDEMHVVEVQGDRRQERTVEASEEDWLPPAAASRYVSERLAAGDERIAYRTFDPASSLQPIEMVIKVLGDAEVDLYGRKVQAVKRQMFSSALPGMVVEEFADREGRPLRTKVKFGGLEMEMIAADRELATSPVSPPELLMQTLITPDFRIDKPRRLRKITYRLTVSEGELPDLPTTSTQRFERIDERSATLAIDLDRPAKANDEARPPVTHNIMIDGRDKVIVDLAAKAIKGAEGDDAAGRAEALRRFVRSYIQRADLSVGMASASEVARARVGDCTEHGVLLAALLKAADIPARVASGIIYVDTFAGADHVFGYHMWTQAWIDGRWVNLDATIGNDYDAAHILLSTSDLGDEHLTNDMVVLGPLLGRLKIERVDAAK